jgi:hypothetical protein
LSNNAKTFRKNLYGVVSSLEDPKDREIAKRLQRKINVDDLLGADFPVEGVLADGAKSTWRRIATKSFISPFIIPVF